MNPTDGYSQLPQTQTGQEPTEPDRSCTYRIVVGVGILLMVLSFAAFISIVLADCVFPATGPYSNYFGIVLAVSLPLGIVFFLTGVGIMYLYFKQGSTRIRDNGRI